MQLECEPRPIMSIKQINGNSFVINLLKLDSFEMEALVTNNSNEKHLISIKALATFFGINPITVTRLCTDVIVKSGKISKANKATALALKERLSPDKHRHIPTIQEINRLFS